MGIGYRQHLPLISAALGIVYGILQPGIRFCIYRLEAEFYGVNRGAVQSHADDDIGNALYGAALRGRGGAGIAAVI